MPGEREDTHGKLEAPGQVQTWNLLNTKAEELTHSTKTLEVTAATDTNKTSLLCT